MDSLSRELNELGVRLLSRITNSQKNTDNCFQNCYYVTSSVSGEGKSFIAGALANYLSSLSTYRVALIDANFRSPKLHKTYGNDQMHNGLSDILTGDCELKSCMMPTIRSNFSVLGAGQSLKPASLFHRETVKNILSQLTDMYDICIFDGDSLEESGGNSLPRLVDNVIFVIQAERTRREVGRAGLAKLNLTSETFVGAVFNRVPHHIPQFYYNWI